MDKITAFWSALYHDVGKPATTLFNEKKQDVQALQHESIGAEIAKNVFETLIPKKMIPRIVSIIAEHMVTESISDKKILQKADEMASSNSCWDDVLALRMADGLGRICSKTREEWIEENILISIRIFNLGVLHNPLSVLITGKDLVKIGFKPGTIFGKICEEVRNLQLAQRISTPEEAIAFAQKRFDNISSESDTKNAMLKRVRKSLNDIFKMSGSLMLKTINSLKESKITDSDEAVKFCCNLVYEIKMGRKNL